MFGFNIALVIDYFWFWCCKADCILSHISLVPFFCFVLITQRASSSRITRTCDTVCFIILSLDFSHFNFLIGFSPHSFNGLPTTCSPLEVNPACCCWEDNRTLKLWVILELPYQSLIVDKIFQVSLSAAGDWVDIINLSARWGVWHHLCPFRVSGYGVTAGSLSPRARGGRVGEPANLGPSCRVKPEPCVKTWHIRRVSGARNVNAI